MDKRRCGRVVSFVQRSVGWLTHYCWKKIAVSNRLRRRCGESITDRGENRRENTRKRLRRESKKRSGGKGEEVWKRRKEFNIISKYITWMKVIAFHTLIVSL